MYSEEKKRVRKPKQRILINGYEEKKNATDKDSLWSHIVEYIEVQINN
jgi:hypothetical protein